MEELKRKSSILFFSFSLTEAWWRGKQKELLAAPGPVFHEPSKVYPTSESVCTLLEKFFPIAK